MEAHRAQSPSDEAYNAWSRNTRMKYEYKMEQEENGMDQKNAKTLSTFTKSLSLIYIMAIITVTSSDRQQSDHKPQLPMVPKKNCSMGCTVQCEKHCSCFEFAGLHIRCHVILLELYPQRSLTHWGSKCELIETDKLPSLTFRWLETKTQSFDVAAAVVFNWLFKQQFKEVNSCS